ncbi:hypothetical protein RQP46_002288 [Phenoliferia psychrophenolica]
MATIDSLAPELLVEILDLPRYSDILSASLICRRWREPAQRALFQTGSFSSNGDVRTRKARFWLDSPARPRYRTKSLDFGWIGTQSNLLSEVLEATPNLESLAFGPVEGVGRCWCPPLGVQLANNLKRLILQYPAYSPPSTIYTPLVLPHLQSLDVYLGGYENDLFPLSLLKVLFQPVANTLTFLCLRNPLEESIINLLADVFAAAPFQNVRHLVLDGWDPVGTPWCRLLKSYPSLLTLELAKENNCDYVPEAVVTAVGASVPPTLENLIFGDDYGGISSAALKALLDTIRLPNLAGLRRLAFPGMWEPKEELANVEGLALLEECGERSITVLSGNGYWTRSIRKDEWVLLK